MYLNFIGFSTFLFSLIVLNSLKHINIYSKSEKKLKIFTSFLVLPGLYNVCIKLLKRNNNKIAQLFSPGDRNDRIDLGFKCLYKYKYINLNSGFKGNVSNTLIESWLDIIDKEENKVIEKNSIMFRNDMRYTFLKKIKVNLNKSVFSENIEIKYGTYYKNLVYVIIQFLTVIMFILTVIEKDTLGILIIILNMSSSFLIVLFLSMEEISVPHHPYSYYNDSSKEYILITNKNGNNMCIIEGNIGTQYLLDNNVFSKKLNSVLERFEVFIHIFVCIISIITILLIPLMKNKSKIFYTISLLMGFLYIIIESLSNNNTVFKKIIKKYYDFEKGIKIKFSNRASAIAYILLYTKCELDVLENLVPDHSDWKYYLLLLNEMKKLNISEINILLKNIKNKETEFIKILIKTGLGKRLLKDIEEALIEIHHEVNIIKK